MKKRPKGSLLYLGIILLVLFVGMAVPLSVQGGTTTRVSVASDGTQANAGSSDPSISADGRYIAFASSASNLVSEDTNNASDVFVHDRVTGQTTRVSVSSDGTQGNDDSGSASISADGRYVVFASSASNLVSGDNNVGDVFVHDRVTGQTTLVSVASDGTQGDNASWSPSISVDGRYVAFQSRASNLVSEDTNGGYGDIFVHDRVTGQTTLVSVASDGTQGNSEPQSPSISADGRYVAFACSSNLVPNDTNGGFDIFVHDRVTGQTTRVSVASDGTQGNAGGPMSGSGLMPSISADGRYVAFESDATNLVPGETNGYRDIFVHDRMTGLTTRVSVASDGTQANERSYHPSISADGRYVAFYSSASNLGNGAWGTFVHDQVTGQTTMVSVASDGTPGYGGYPSISADGRYVAFYSQATNLVSGDTNGALDVFVHDRQGGSVGPFLDLPISLADPYTGLTGNKSGTTGNKVNSWFDHQYPTYNKDNKDNKDGKIRLYDQINPLEGAALGSCSNGYNCYDGHNGIDFQHDYSKPNEPVLAAASGTVVEICDNYSAFPRCSRGYDYGNYVVINHTGVSDNRYATMYAHLRSVDQAISLNPVVLSGQQIGIMGNTGTERIHLHFSVFYDENNDREWAFSEVVDPFGWEGSDEDPWVTANGPTSRWLWKYPRLKQAVIGTQGGTISTPEGKVTVTIPPENLTEPVTVELSRLSSIKRIASNFRSLGRSIWLRVLDWLSPGNTIKTFSEGLVNFPQPITITFKYPENLSPI